MTNLAKEKKYIYISHLALNTLKFLKWPALLLNMHNRHRAVIIINHLPTHFLTKSTEYRAATEMYTTFRSYFLQWDKFKYHNSLKVPQIHPDPEQDIPINGHEKND